MVTLRGKCSWFGGPEDTTGVGPDEALAFIYEVDMAPHLFLEHQPAGTTGLARRLNPDVFYIACRWDYDETSKEELLSLLVHVYAPKTGKKFTAFPADWGPNSQTGRVADLSKGLLDALGLQTDDEVEVTYTPPGEEIVSYFNRIAMSSGHSSKCQGAIGPKPWGLNEVAEARRVVDRTATLLRERKVSIATFHDDVSTTQGANLDRIVSWHNQQDRQLDVSCHFNAHHVTSDPMGTEVWWETQAELAGDLSAAMAEAGGFIDRGPKDADGDLMFLRETSQKSVLLEVCFVDSEADVRLYRDRFEQICSALADTLGGPLEEEIKPPVEPSTDVPLVEIAISAPDGVHLRITLDGSVVLDEGAAD